MKKQALQKHVRDSISKELGNGGSLSELRALANRILEICQKFGDEIPNTEILKVLNEHPGIDTELTRSLQKEIHESSEAAVEAIRQNLKSRMS